MLSGAGMADYDASIIIPMGEGDRPEGNFCEAVEKQTWPLGKFEVIFISAELDSRSMAAHDERRVPGAVAMRHIRIAGTVEPDLIHRGARSARGSCLIFLGPDLLPSSHFVEAHVAAHRDRNGWGLAYGVSLPHPRLRPGKFTRWTLLGEKPVKDATGDVSGGETVSCCGNFSILKERYFDAGGMPGGYFTVAMALAALGGRVRKKGGSVFHVPRARAMLWRSTDLDTLRRWMYLRGMDLYALKKDDQDLHELLCRQFQLDRLRLIWMLDGLYRATREKICRESPQDVRVLGAILERLLIQDRRQGYRDARRHKRPAWNPMTAPVFTDALSAEIEEPTTDRFGGL